MNHNYRKTLLAATIAALISAPAWSATDSHISSSDEAKPHDSRSENVDSKGEGWQAVDGASRAKMGKNPLYNHTPDELSGMEVVGSDGEVFGEIKTVVMARSRDEIHAVISSGGVMGMGTREVLVPVSELKLVKNDKVQSSLTKETISERPEFKAEHYGVMESNRRIGDFSGFKPTMSAESQAAAVAAADAVKSKKAAEKSNSEAAADKPSGKTKQSEKTAASLDRRTPNDLQGMEVVGLDCQSIGKVNSVVSSKNPDQAHAVIASGGFLGLGERKILVPLNSLKSVGTKQLQADFNQDSVELRAEYQSEQYGALAADRPINEFLAFEPDSNR